MPAGYNVRVTLNRKKKQISHILRCFHCLCFPLEIPPGKYSTNTKTNGNRTEMFEMDTSAIPQERRLGLQLVSPFRPQ